MANNILEVLEEMVNEAAKEIGFEVSEANVEMVILNIYSNYEITLDETAPITWRIMQIITHEVQEWQEETQVNFC